jgi:tRNA(Ile)-lysidine synthase TilS/MesJ
MSKIITFWRANEKYWISISKREEADRAIRDMFWDYEWSQENLIGQVIYLDQFSRHFQRAGLITEQKVKDNRLKAINIIMANLIDLRTMDEIEIVFALMPFKHLEIYNFIFEYLHNVWLNGKKLVDFSRLQKFYIDTYKKAFTLDRVRSSLITSHTLEPYDASLICDYYPDRYSSDDWSLNGLAGEKLLDLVPESKVAVSLSGGVDSMVLLTLLKYKGADVKGTNVKGTNVKGTNVKGTNVKGTNVKAVHIIYGNRAESEHEYRLLAEFCAKLEVPLIVYRIQWLRRGECDRQFYEDMTRELRFMVYRALGCPVVLGHIKDDVIENIWTNIAHCHHLGNLKKMETEEVQLGVRLLRPFLGVEKADIYRVSELIGIPYFKNTTPSWSNRGKFREHFHKATMAQYSEGINKKIIEFSEAVQTQGLLLNKLLYDPIYESFKDESVNITTAFKARLDANSWVGIFEHICHKFLGCSRPSTKAVKDFCERLYKIGDKMTVEMGKGLKVIINRADNEVNMKFILL